MECVRVKVVLALVTRELSVEAEHTVQLLVSIPVYGNELQCVKAAARARDAIQLSINSNAKTVMVEPKKKKSGKIVIDGYQPIPHTDIILGKD